MRAPPGAAANRCVRRELGCVIELYCLLKLEFLSNKFLVCGILFDGIVLVNRFVLVVARFVLVVDRLVLVVERGIIELNPRGAARRVPILRVRDIAQRRR